MGLAFHCQQASGCCPGDRWQAGARVLRNRSQLAPASGRILPYPRPGGTRATQAEVLKEGVPASSAVQCSEPSVPHLQPRLYHHSPGLVTDQPQPSSLLASGSCHSVSIDALLIVASPSNSASDGGFSGSMGGFCLLQLHLEQPRMGGETRSQQAQTHIGSLPGQGALLSHLSPKPLPSLFTQDLTQE